MGSGIGEGCVCACVWGEGGRMAVVPRLGVL